MSDSSDPAAADSPELSRALSGDPSAASQLILRASDWADRERSLVTVAEAIATMAPYPYEIYVTEVAVALPDLVVRELRDYLLRPPPDTAPDTPLRRLCATAVLAAYRRGRLHSQGRRLGDALADEFEAWPLFWHFRALTYLDGTASELREGQDLERCARDALPDHAGIAHALATFTLGLAADDPRFPRELLEEALVDVNRALHLYSKRPRFLYTRARIYRRLGKFAEAREDLHRAIDQEDRGASDHRERIFDYQIELALIETAVAARGIAEEAQAALAKAQVAIDEIEQRTAEATERFRDSQVRVVETIAFFAVVLALVPSTVSTFGRRPLFQAMALIVVMAVVLFGAVTTGAVILGKVSTPKALRSRPRKSSGE